MNRGRLLRRLTFTDIKRYQEVEKVRKARMAAKIAEAKAAEAEAKLKEAEIINKINDIDIEDTNVEEVSDAG